MALLLLDNFETTDDLNARYTVSGTLATTNTLARSGSYSLSGTVFGAHYIGFPIASIANGFVGLAVNFEDIRTSRALVAFNYSTSAQCSVYLLADNRIAVYRGLGTNLLKTSVKALHMNKWYYIEIKWKIADSISAGDFSIRVNGEEWLSVDAASDTKAGTSALCDMILFYSYCSSADVCTFLDDIYVCDSTGSANNTFLGPIIIENLTPNGNGNYSQFTGSDGNSTDNYLLVDDAVEDGDTTYVEESTVDERDSYTISSFSVSPATIIGIAVESYTKKSDANVKSFRHFVRIGGTNYESATFTAGEAYDIFQHIWDVSPATSSAWGESEVEGMEVGIKVQA